MMKFSQIGLFVRTVTVGILAYAVVKPPVKPTLIQEENKSIFSVSVSVENTIQRSQIEATRIGRVCAWSNFCLNLMLVLFQDLKYSGFEVGWILNLHNWVR